MELAIVVAADKGVFEFHLKIMIFIRTEDTWITRKPNEDPICKFKSQKVSKMYIVWENTEWR